MMKTQKQRKALTDEELKLYEGQMCRRIGDWVKCNFTVSLKLMKRNEPKGDKDAIWFPVSPAFRGKKKKQEVVDKTKTNGSDPFVLKEVTI